MPVKYNELAPHVQVQVMSAYIEGTSRSVAALARRFEVTVPSLTYACTEGKWVEIRRNVFADRVERLRADAADSLALLDSSLLTLVAKSAELQICKLDTAEDDPDEADAIVGGVLEFAERINQVASVIKSGIGPLSGSAIIGVDPAIAEQSRVLNADGQEEFVPTNSIKSAKELTAVVVSDIVATFTKDRQEKATADAGVEPGEDVSVESPTPDKLVKPPMSSAVIPPPGVPIHGPRPV